MQSTLDQKQTDPRDVYARVDEEIARAYEQIALADKQLSNLAPDAARHPPGAVNNAQVQGARPSIGGRAVRGVVGLLLAACIGVAAIVWQSSYGDAARQIVAKWAPQLVLTASLPPPENPGLSAQPTPPAVDPPAVEVAAANPAPPEPEPLQPAPSAQAAPEAVAPIVAALSPESAQLLQSMAHDIASVGQEIEQLKASIEQLRASQQQLSRDVAKASEQNLRPTISAP